MPTTQKQIEANRQNAKKSTGPTTPEGKTRSSLNATRHGLTGQVALMPEEDRHAFNTLTNAIRNAYNPVGALEIQIAQSIAEDEWRLNRARAIENNCIALGHSMEAGDLDTSHPEIHAAMTQARVFWNNPETFALLTTYEQRISRKVQRNEERLRTLQTDRKNATLQALSASRVTTRTAAESTPKPANGFVCSTPVSAAPQPAPAPKNVLEFPHIHERAA